jgi:hypothetical protein
MVSGGRGAVAKQRLIAASTRSAHSLATFCSFALLAARSEHCEVAGTVAQIKSPDDRNLPGLSGGTLTGARV